MTHQGVRVDGSEGGRQQVDGLHAVRQEVHVRKLVLHSEALAWDGMGWDVMAWHGMARH